MIRKARMSLRFAQAMRLPAAAARQPVAARMLPATSTGCFSERRSRSAWWAPCWCGPPPSAHRTCRSDGLRLATPAALLLACRSSRARRSPGGHSALHSVLFVAVTVALLLVLRPLGDRQRVPLVDALGDLRVQPAETARSRSSWPSPRVGPARPRPTACLRRVDSLGSQRYRSG